MCVGVCVCVSKNEESYYKIMVGQLGNTYRHNCSLKSAENNCSTIEFQLGLYSTKEFQVHFSPGSSVFQTLRSFKTYKSCIET